MLQETSYLCPMNEGGGDVSLSNFLDATDDKGKDIGISKMEDLDVRMDLTDDLLHMVFTSCLASVPSELLKQLFITAKFLIKEYMSHVLLGILFLGPY